MTILILFYIGAFKNLKSFYIFYVQKHVQKNCPNTVSYNRFVELQRTVSVPLAVLVKMMCMGKCTWISFIDSTPLRSCHIKREKQHKTFKEVAEKGQCPIGWFYSFKLHLVINDKGEILDFIPYPGVTWMIGDHSGRRY